MLNRDRKIRKAVSGAYRALHFTFWGKEFLQRL